VVIAAIVGAFDAVLLIAIPSLFLWTIAGALAPAGKARVTPDDGSRSRVRRGGRNRCARCAPIQRPDRGDVGLHVGHDDRAGVPGGAVRSGSFRINMRLADSYAARADCKHVRQYAGAARELYPNAAGPKRLLRRCPR
jgi:hypothetical protein